MSITFLFKSSILSEAGVVAGAAARQTEAHIKWSNLLRTGLEVCSTSDGDIWYMGKNSRPVFAQLAVRLAAQDNPTKATMLNSIYGRLSPFLVRANARAFIARYRSISEATTMDLFEG